MNASLSYLNCGDTLLARAKSADDRRPKKKPLPKTVSRPGGFRNDPDDPNNPNEVRERHLKKVDKRLGR